MPKQAKESLKRPDLKGNFQCYTCQKVFCHSSSLSRHRTTAHFKSYTCTECGEVITTNEMLRSHMHSHHNISRMFFCQCCNWGFADKNNLHNHMMSMLKTQTPGEATVLATSTIEDSTAMRYKNMKSTTDPLVAANQFLIDWLANNAFGLDFTKAYDESGNVNKKEENLMNPIHEEHKELKMETEDLLQVDLESSEDDRNSYRMEQHSPSISNVSDTISCLGRGSHECDDCQITKDQMRVIETKNRQYEMEIEQLKEQLKKLQKKNENLLTTIPLSPTALLGFSNPLSPNTTVPTATAHVLPPHPSALFQAVLQKDKAPENEGTLSPNAATPASLLPIFPSSPFNPLLIEASLQNLKETENKENPQTATPPLFSLPPLHPLLMHLLQEQGKKENPSQLTTTNPLFVPHPQHEKRNSPAFPLFSPPQPLQALFMQSVLQNPAILQQYILSSANLQPCS